MLPTGCVSLEKNRSTPGLHRALAYEINQQFFLRKVSFAILLRHIFIYCRYKIYCTGFIQTLIFVVKICFICGSCSFILWKHIVWRLEDGNTLVFIVRTMLTRLWIGNYVKYFFWNLKLLYLRTFGPPFLHAACIMHAYRM